MHSQSETLNEALAWERGSLNSSLRRDRLVSIAPAFYAVGVFEVGGGDRLWAKICILCKS